MDVLDTHTHSNVRPPGCQLLLRALDDASEPTADRQEHRCSFGRGRGVRSAQVTGRGERRDRTPLRPGRRRWRHRAQSLHEAAGLPFGPQQCREHRRRAHRVDRSRVDAPYEGVGKEVVYLGAQPPANDRSDRFVVIVVIVVLGLTGRFSPGRCRGTKQVECRSSQAHRRADARSGQRAHSCGQSQCEPGGQLAQRTTSPHERAAGAGRDEVRAEAQIVAERRRLRAPGQEGVRAEVHGPSADLTGEQLAAEALVGFEQHHTRTARQGGDELPSCRQPGDPAAYDRDGEPVAVLRLAPVGGMHLLCGHVSS